MPLIIDLLPALFFRQAENLQWNKFCLDIQIQTIFVIRKSCISRSDLRVCFSVFSPQQYPQPGSWGRTATGQAYLILPLNNLLAFSWFWLRISWAEYCLCDLITLSGFPFHELVPPWAEITPYSGKIPATPSVLATGLGHAKSALLKYRLGS